LSGEETKNATAQSLALKQSRYKTENATRFQSELQDLKKLVETGPAQRANKPTVGTDPS
jgi:hypothetical protein